MKLVIREPATEQQKEIDIRNPRATVVNLRAAIGVYWKIKDPKTLQLFVEGVDLSDEQKPLCDLGLKDGSVVTLSRKRSRDDEPTASVATDKKEETTPPAAVVSTTASATTATTASSPQGSATAAASGQQGSGDPIQRLVDMGFTADDARLALTQTRNDVPRATELLLGGGIFHLGEGGLDESGDDEDDDDDFEDIDDEDDEEDSFEGDPSDDDEGELTQEEEEQGRLAMGLLTLGDPRHMAQQFIANPQQMMATIQQNQPELFNLIGRHHQFFLDLVNESAQLPEIDEEAEDDDDDELGDHDDDDLASGLLAQLAQAGPGRSTAVQPSVELTDEDNQKIETLMALGFTRDQCLAAYLRCGRNTDRAANFLFENPPNDSS